MKYVINMLRMLFLTICGFAINAVSIAQCVTPVITSIGNSGPVCEGGTINLTAAGTIGGVSSSFVRMAGIGANAGNRAFNTVFSSGDRAGSIARISTNTYNALAAGGPAAVRAEYDVLLFTWASPNNLNINWPFIESYLALGGSIFWEDEVNVGKLAPGVVGSQFGGSYNCSYIIVTPAPFPILVANGINGCFANHHLRTTSWPSWMDDYIKGPGGENFAIAGIYPTGSRGRFIVQGPDQDYHAVRGGGDPGGNQYKMLLNQLDFLTAEQAGFSWTGPNGFTSNEANPIITGATSANAGVYTATLTNLTGGGCFTTATTTVVVNSAPILGCNAVTASTDAGQCSAVVAYSPTVTGATSTSYTFVGATTGSGSGTGSGEAFNKGVTDVTITATNNCGSTSCTFSVTVTDEEKPVLTCPSDASLCFNATETYTIPQLAATDNCNINDISYAITGATTRSGSGTDASGNFSLGQSTITWTVRDVNGNVETCTTEVTVTKLSCSITAIPSDNTYTGGVPTNIYLGYGPQSVTLTPTVAGGSSFTYSWSPATGLDNPSSATPIFTPTAAGTYTFTLTATNTETGCTSACSITICVLDIRVPGTNGKKVYVCHVPPGNTGNGQTIEVSVNSVSVHIFNPGHGDKLGQCNQTCNSTPVTAPISRAEREQTIRPALKLQAFPNPANRYFNIHLEGFYSTDKVNLRVVDAYGRLIEKRNNVAPNQTIQLGNNYRPGSYIIEVIQGKERKTLNVIKKAQ